MLTENETSAEAVEELTDLELRGELINYLCSFMLVAPRAFNRYQGIVREKRALAACCSPQKSQLFIDDAVVAEINNDRKRDSSFIAKFEKQKQPLLNFFGCGADAFRAVEICHSDKSKAEAHFKKLARAIRETRYNVSLPEFETSIKKLKKQYFKLTDALTELPAEPAPESIATETESIGSPKAATAESKPIKTSGASSKPKARRRGAKRKYDEKVWMPLYNECRNSSQTQAQFAAEKQLDVDEAVKAFSAMRALISERSASQKKATGDKNAISEK